MKKIYKMVDGEVIETWDFTGFGSITYFWSSSPLRGTGAISHWNLTLIRGKDEISSGYSDNANFLSVRCIKNE
jgi:hypothetical protein